MTPDEAAIAEGLAVNWLVFRRHFPAGAYLPVGQLDGDCRECGHAWPCTEVMARLAPLLAQAREDATTAALAPIEALAEEWDHRYDAGDHMLGCPDGAGYYDLLADELRAAITTARGGRHVQRDD